VNAIRMTVIPLVASLLVVAVGSTGDVKSIGRIGGRTLLVFFLLLAGTAMVVMPLAATVSRLLPQHADVHQLPIGAAEAADLILVRSYSPNQSGLIRENISQRARQGE
jgi:Na+/H+-dicarboxylate symporter